MQLVEIDRLEMKINLANEVDNKVNDKADMHKKRAVYLVCIITIVIIAYNSKIHKHHDV